jgi:molybdenum cofactor biosynthesis enzyme MoaA
MAESSDGPSIPWVVPVYLEKEGLEQFAVCKHCNRIRREHAGEEEKCLFAASTFFVLKKSPLK